MFESAPDSPPAEGFMETDGLHDHDWRLSRIFLLNHVIKTIFARIKKQPQSQLYFSLTV